MSPQQLLQELEQLSYSGRIQRMVEVGRLASDDQSVRATLQTFAQGDMYQRLMVAQSCFGSYDAALVLRLLVDRSHGVRRLVARLVALVCDDAEVQTALDSVELKLKIGIARDLGKRGRQEVLDRYLAILAQRQDPAFKRFLSFGSEELVKRYLPEMMYRLELQNWRSLAHRHPSLVVEQLQVTSASFLDQRHLLQINAVLPVLADSSPDLALALVQNLLTVTSLARLNLQKLAQKRPVAIADLLLASNEECAISFSVLAQNRLDIERLLALYSRYPSAVRTYQFHKKLAAPKRLAIYSALERGLRTNEGVLPYTIVAALPSAQRLLEARRNLDLPALATRPLERIAYASFLPWDEAVATLHATLRSPDADLRGATLKALITATRYQRDRLPAAIQLILQRKNEQDPVRSQVLTALAELPVGIWKAEHLADLAQIIRDALNATDLSHLSAAVMGRLVLRLVPFHPAWSAQQIALIYKERGQASVYSIEGYLSDADVRRIAPELLPVFQSWFNRENENRLLHFASFFGRRLRVFPELLDILTNLATDTRSSYTAESALSLLALHQPQRLATLIPRMLETDKSFIVLSSVSSYLHRYRQNLLTPFLGQQAYKGRFSTGRTRFLLPVNGGFYRWTPTQQQLFAATLVEVLQDKQRTANEPISVINRLAIMPALDASYLAPFANDSRVVVRNATLRALGRFDAGQGVSLLVEALNDDRARIAIYALRSAVLALPESEALALLLSVPLTKVTVAKEAIRLLGDLSSDAAYRELLALEQRELHRDVRVALLRALWTYLERPETWEILTRAAQSSDPALTHTVVRIPSDGLSSTANQQLLTVMTLLLTRPEPEVRIIALQRCVEQPLSDVEHRLLPVLVNAIHSPFPDECTQAARATFALYITAANSAPLLGEAVRSTLKQRRALQICIATFMGALNTNRQRALPTTRSILNALTEDRLTLKLRISLIFAGLPWHEIAPQLTQLADQLHPDALVTALGAIFAAVGRPDADPLALETAFASSSDERFRRLALATLIAQASQKDGWTDERVERLRIYQQDPSPLVAEAAQFVFPS